MANGSSTTGASQTVISEGKQFWGHPRGLATLFFTEIWERFSYYGMRALLILYMTADTEHGGLQFDVPTAGAIYGLYTAMVYMTGLPGGWIADRFLGARRSVLIGAIVIAIGHFSMAFHGNWFFFQGLVLIVLGTGLLKPNISSMVGSLYAEGDNRRDAGFSIFYMGINLGAFIAPLVCGYLGQRVDWHYGFAAAGFGMMVGIIQYSMGSKYLGQAGLPGARDKETEEHRKSKRTLIMTIGIVVLAVIGIVLVQSVGIISLTVGGLSNTFGIFILLLPVVYFVGLFAKKEWTPIERKRIAVVAILFVFSALFWAAFEQAGSTLNLFADRLTQNSVFGIEFPSSWFQSVNSIFIITLAPVFAWLWIKLGKREPSSPAKFSWGLLFVGLGYLVLAGGAFASGQAQLRVSPMWLVITYLLHTFGELCLSPVGLSTVTKLAPKRIGSQLMGIWFLTISVGNYIGGQVAGLFEKMDLPLLFLTVFGTTAVAGIILFLLIKPIRNLMGGVH